MRDQSRPPTLFVDILIALPLALVAAFAVPLVLSVLVLLLAWGLEAVMLEPGARLSSVPIVHWIGGVGVGLLMLTWHLFFNAWAGAIASLLAASGLACWGGRRRIGFLFLGALAGGLGLTVLWSVTLRDDETTTYIIRGASLLGGLHGGLAALAFRAILARLHPEAFTNN